MLRASGGLVEADAGTAPLRLQKLHLLDVFILDFCSRIVALLRRGAIRAYEVFEDELIALRGKLLLVEQFRRADADLGRLHCRFDELSTDNSYNRALKAVLRRLLPQAMGPEAIGSLTTLLRRLDEVLVIPCSAADIDRLTFTRLTEAWRPVFQQAAWFLRGLLPDVRAGGVEGVSLVFDMERLFETFVGARLRRAWRLDGSGRRLVLQGPREHLADSSDGRAFRLRPDAAVVSSGGEVERVLDAKWKHLEPGAITFGVAREDAYQLAAYAGAYRCQVVALVYPRPDGFKAGLVGSFDLRLPGAARIDVYALDLVATSRGAPLLAGLCPAPI